MPLRFAVVERRFWDLFLLLSQACPCSFGLCPSPAQPSPSQLSPAQPSPAQLTAQALVWAMPKLCQMLFLTGFRGAILGRRNAPFLLRFWPVWGRRAAAFLVLSPAPSLGVGLAVVEALQKAFSYLAQPSPA